MFIRLLCVRGVRRACLLVPCTFLLLSSRRRRALRSSLNARSHLCHHSGTIAGRDEHFDTSLLPLSAPLAFSSHFSPFLVRGLFPEYIGSAAAHSHTYLYTQMPWPLSGPGGYTERYVLASCSLISSSHTHSGCAITSGGPVRHECYPVDNNHSGGKEQTQSHIC